MTRPRFLPPSRRQTRSIILLLVLGLASALEPASAQLLSQTGRWTQPSDWGGGDPKKYAVHLLLLRADGNPLHSRILWFHGQNLGVFRGGEWGWRDSSYTCEAWPTSIFRAIPVDTTEADFFCTGHVTLPDGRALLGGGSHAVTGNYGENKSRIFAPGPDSSKSTWTIPDSLDEWRWYPSLAPLRSGALILGGIQHRRIRVLGGRHNGQAPDTATGKLVYRFAGIPNGTWDEPVVPALEGTSQRPAPRTDHTSVDLPESTFEFAHVLFGGKSESGAPLNDTWLLKRYNNPPGSDFGADFHYTWKDADPTGAPFKRSEHSAVWARLVNIPAGSTTDQMVIFGGLGEGGAVFSDVHRLRKGVGLTYAWQLMTIDSVTSSPTPRLGHGSAFHQTVLTSGDTLRRMIVFGGARGPGEAPTDTTVWELRFETPSDPNRGTWRKLAAGGLGPTGPVPSARAGHAMVRDPFRRERPGDTREGSATFVHGGKLSFGVAPFPWTVFG